jgi:hypothetical protein
MRQPPCNDYYNASYGWVLGLARRYGKCMAASGVRRYRVGQRS